MEFPTLQNDLILRAARGEKVERAPVWIMRQAGRYLPEFREVRAEHGFFTVCRTPELATLVTIQPVERYAGLLDAAIIFSDILVIPQAMGLEVEMVPGKGPHFPDPLTTPDDLHRLTPSPIDVRQELGYVMDALTMCRKELKGRVPLIGFAGAPWTLMAYMIEGGGSKTLSKAKTWLYRWPEESKQLLERITQIVVDFLCAQVDAGAQMLQVFDSWGGELSPECFATFSLPYLTQIAAQVKAKHPDIPMTVFAKGAHYALEDLAATAYNTISLDWTLDPMASRKRVNGKVLQGNLDPSVLYADEDAIRAHARTMTRAFFTEQRGYIANLGHGMYPDMRPEALGWYLDEVHKSTTHN
jgi:uroporphyrinogen decarboxylase